jgi:hypothetical protein
MKMLLICSLVIFKIPAWCQEKTSKVGVWTRVTKPTLLKTKPTIVGFDDHQVHVKEKVFVTDVTMEPRLYKVVYRNCVYYIADSAIYFSSELLSFTKAKRIDFDRNIRWVIPSFISLKTAPSSSSENVVELNRGMKVLVIEKLQTWLKVKDLVNLNGDGWLNEEEVSAVEIMPLSWDEMRKEEFFRANPSIHDSTRTAIRNSLVIEGMTKEMVKASLGPPSELKGGLDKNGETIEIWTFGKMRITFKGNRLVSF